MQEGRAAPDEAVALHANRCRRAARGRRAAATCRACTYEPWPAQQMFVGVQDGKNEKDPTKVGFHASGIALANNSAIIVCPQLRAELVSDHPSAAVDYTLTSER